MDNRNIKLFVNSEWLRFPVEEFHANGGKKKSSKSILNPIRTIVNQFRKKETDEMKLSKVGRSVEDL